MADVTQFNDHIWLNHVELGIFDVRGALIQGRDRSLVWDTLSRPSDMHVYRSVLQAQNELLVVYSHADWDHIWGTAGLEPVPSKIMAHTSCAARFYDPEDVELVLLQKKAQEPGKWSDVKLVRPNDIFQENVIVELGGVSVELYHLPGHTDDTTVAFVPESGSLLIGDAAETPFPVLSSRAGIPRWIDQLERWLADKRVQTVIPSHGPIGGKEILKQNITYLNNLYSGRPIQLPSTLTTFYTETHAANLELCS